VTSIAFVVGWVLAALFAIVVCIAYKAIDHVLGENTDLRKKIRGLELAVENYAFSLKLERMSRNQTLRQTLDDKTKSLVRLAVANPEKNEAAAAALLVCRRLKKAIDQ
jgi:hypothetical protein